MKCKYSVCPVIASTTENKVILYRTTSRNKISQYLALFSRKLNLNIWEVIAHLTVSRYNGSCWKMGFLFIIVFIALGNCEYTMAGYSRTNNRVHILSKMSLFYLKCNYEFCIEFLWTFSSKCCLYFTKYQSNFFFCSIYASNFVNSRYNEMFTRNNQITKTIFLVKPRTKKLVKNIYFSDLFFHVKSSPSYLY